MGILGHCHSIDDRYHRMLVGMGFQPKEMESPTAVARSASERRRPAGSNNGGEARVGVSCVVDGKATTSLIFMHNTAKSTGTKGMSGTTASEAVIPC